MTNLPLNSRRLCLLWSLLLRWGGGFPQVELVKLAEPQPSRAFSPSSGQKVVLPWQEAEPKCLLSFLGSQRQTQPDQSRAWSRIGQPFPDPGSPPTSYSQSPPSSLTGLSWVAMITDEHSRAFPENRTRYSQGRSWQRKRRGKVKTCYFLSFILSFHMQTILILLPYFRV